jgi:hypothetical protein
MTKVFTPGFDTGFRKCYSGTATDKPKHSADYSYTRGFQHQDCMGTNCESANHKNSLIVSFAPGQYGEMAGLVVFGTPDLDCNFPVNNPTDPLAIQMCGDQNIIIKDEDPGN